MVLRGAQGWGVGLQSCRVAGCDWSWAMQRVVHRQCCALCCLHELASACLGGQGVLRMPCNTKSWSTCGLALSQLCRKCLWPVQYTVPEQWRLYKVVSCFKSRHCSKLLSQQHRSSIVPGMLSLSTLAI